MGRRPTYTTLIGGPFDGYRQYGGIVTIGAGEHAGCFECSGRCAATPDDFLRDVHLYRLNPLERTAHWVCFLRTESTGAGHGAGVPGPLGPVGSPPNPLGGVS